MRKAQIEIVGLLIIVVIIAFMLLFVVSVMFEEKEPYLPEFNDRIIAGKFIGAMLRTSSMCTQDTDMETLIIDCVKNPDTDGSIVCDNGEQSCIFMSRVLDTLLNNSFDSIQRNYKFEIISPDQQAVYGRVCSAANNCTSKVSTKCMAAEQPLSIIDWGVHKGNMFIRMGLGCG